MAKIIAHRFQTRERLESDLLNMIELTTGFTFLYMGGNPAKGDYIYHINNQSSQTIERWKKILEEKGLSYLGVREYKTSD